MKYKKGATTLITTIIIVSTALVIALSVQYLGIGELIISSGHQQSEQAFQNAQSCLNEAMLKIKLNNSYSGDNLTLTKGTCLISVTNNGSSRLISTVGAYGLTKRKILATVLISGDSLSITNWNEDTN